MRPSPGLLSGGYSDARGVHALVARTFRHILGAYALRFVFVRLCSVKHRRFVSPTRALALLCVAPALRHKRFCELSVITQRSHRTSHFIRRCVSHVCMCLSSRQLGPRTCPQACAGSRCSCRLLRRFGAGLCPRVAVALLVMAVARRSGP